MTAFLSPPVHLFTGAFLLNMDAHGRLRGRGRRYQLQGTGHRSPTYPAAPLHGGCRTLTAFTFTSALKKYGKSKKLARRLRATGAQPRPSAIPAACRPPPSPGRAPLSQRAAAATPRATRPSRTAAAAPGGLRSPAPSRIRQSAPAPPPRHDAIWARDGRGDGRGSRPPRALPLHSLGAGRRTLREPKYPSAAPCVRVPAAPRPAREAAPRGGNYFQETRSRGSRRARRGGRRRGAGELPSAPRPSLASLLPFPRGYFGSSCGGGRSLKSTLPPSFPVRRRLRPLRGAEAAAANGVAVGEGARPLNFSASFLPPLPLVFRPQAPRSPRQLLFSSLPAPFLTQTAVTHPPSPPSPPFPTPRLV